MKEVYAHTSNPATIPVQWGDLDALGHVNHTRFLVWMETARMTLFERVGLHWKNQPDMGPILARAEVDYHAPVHFPAVILATVGVSRIGRTSFVLDYSLTDSSSTPVATGRTVIVLYDYREGKTVEIPNELRTKLLECRVAGADGP